MWSVEEIMVIDNEQVSEQPTDLSRFTVKSLVDAHTLPTSIKQNVVNESLIVLKSIRKLLENVFF